MSPQYTDRKCGTTILRVLKAPSLGSSAMWNAQAFDHTRSRLRGMLNDSITVDEAISFIGEHFPLSTMVAEEEARRVVRLFRSAFDDLGLLDCQSVFDRVILNKSDMYDLDLGRNGLPSAPNHTAVQTRIRKITSIVQFRVFCFDFRNSYVGKGADEQQSEEHIIKLCHRNLLKVKMISVDTQTGKVTHYTPDVVYDRMMQHAALLPENAMKWPFCLPWLFHGALTLELQNAMQEKKFVIPSPQTLTTKTLQISSMTSCRDFGRTELNKMRETGRFIERILHQHRKSARVNTYSVSDLREESQDIMYEDDDQITVDHSWQPSHAHYNKYEDFGAPE